LGETATYEATYVDTTASPPQTSEVAAQPPSSFESRQGTSTEQVELVGDAKAAYSCTHADGSTAWTCHELSPSARKSYGVSINPFLQAKQRYDEVSTLIQSASRHGTTVSTSSREVAGVTLQCVSFVGGSEPHQEICVAADGVLGYAADIPGAGVLELLSLSTSPPPSVFQPPSNATIVTIATAG
jgi:hypothetical protein